MKQEDLNKKIDKTLDSLEGIQRAEPQPYFYTRLTGRLQRNEKTFWETTGAFLAKPAVAVASLCFIIVLNGFILFRQDSEILTSKTQLPTTASETVMSTDNEYILASSSSFDYENLFKISSGKYSTFPTDGNPISATRASPDFITSNPSPYKTFNMFLYYNI